MLCHSRIVLSFLRWSHYQLIHFRHTYSAYFCGCSFWQQNMRWDSPQDIYKILPAQRSGRIIYCELPWLFLYMDYKSLKFVHICFFFIFIWRHNLNICGVKHMENKLAGLRSSSVEWWTTIFAFQGSAVVRFTARESSVEIHWPVEVCMLSLCSCESSPGTSVSHMKLENEVYFLANTLEKCHLVV